MHIVTLTDNQNETIIVTLYVNQSKIEGEIDSAENLARRWATQEIGIDLSSENRQKFVARQNARRAALLRRRADLIELVRIFTAE